MLASQFADLFDEGINLREVRRGIWSAHPETDQGQAYDGRARGYDALIGNRFYNRLAWGTSPASYSAFASKAAQSGAGAMLDAGCGTLVSTYEIHAQSGRRTVLLDLSLDMLERGRERIQAAYGNVPDHVLFVQGDLRQLPFRANAFGSILNPGILHLFADIEALMRELSRVTSPEGTIHSSSLVDDRWLSRHYLRLLHSAGEAAPSRSFAELIARLNDTASGLASPVEAVREGSMAFVTAKPAH